MKRKTNRCGGASPIDLLESRAYLSTTSFANPVFLTGVNDVTSIAVGDLTGNGRDDLVVAGEAPSAAVPAVGVYLSSSDGSLGTPTLFPISGSTAGVGLGDFLDNGKQDIAVVDSADNTLDVFINDGSGNFAPGAGVSLSGSGGDTSLSVGDFNKDGKDDVAVVDPADNSVNTYTSVGDSGGTFVAGGSIAVPSPEKVIAADLNGDGYADLLVLSSASPNSIYVALNNGNGTFETPLQYQGNTSISDFTVDDFNGDRAPDVIMVGPDGGSVPGVGDVLLNQEGQFSANIPFSTLPPDVSLVAADEFTQSGDQDIATISSTGALDIFAGDGFGDFGQDQSIFTTQLGTPGSQAVVADFNGDGLPDIAFISSSPGNIGVVLNTTGVVAPPPVTQDLTATLTGPTPSSFVSGTPLKLKEKLTLATASSGAVSGTASADILLSPDTTAADSVLTLSTTSATLKLKAGKSKAFTLKLPKSIPTTVAAGTYDVLIKLTDTAGVVKTIDSGQTIIVAAPAVDLSGVFVKASTLVKAGKKATATFDVINSTAANVAADGFLPIDIELSTDGLLGDAVLLDTKKVHINLLPGKSTKITISEVISASTYLVIALDPGHTAFADDINSGAISFATASPVQAILM